MDFLNDPAWNWILEEDTAKSPQFGTLDSRNTEKSLFNLEVCSFDVILADPPWEYDSPRALVGQRRNIGNVQVDVSAKYSTLCYDKLARIPVHKVAKKDSFLFLWVTNPFLADGTGTRLVKSWGFTPKTIITWAKVKKDLSSSMKTGYWFRSASEHVIFASRGNVRRPVDFEPIPSWFPHERLGHSVKPDTIHKIAEKLVPDGAYLEMFARRIPEGNWAVWGNEVQPTHQGLHILDTPLTKSSV
jgi:N6-adenosine-specific RNA methylase IME4